MTFINILKNKKEFDIISKYDSRLVSFIRNLKCGKWNNQKKKWTIPSNYYNSFQEFLRKNKYDYIESDDSVPLTIPIIQAYSKFIFPCLQEQTISLEGKHSIRVQTDNTISQLQIDALFSNKPQQFLVQDALMISNPISTLNFDIANSLIDLSGKFQLPESIKMLYDIYRKKDKNINYISIYFYDHHGSIYKHDIRKLAKDTQVYLFNFGLSQRNLVIEPHIKSNGYVQYIVKCENCVVKFNSDLLFSFNYCISKTFNSFNNNTKRILIEFKCFEK